MSQLGIQGARHLLARTGIGAQWTDVKTYQAYDRQRAVSAVIKHHLKPQATLKAPAFTPWIKMKALRQDMTGMRSIMRVSKTEGVALQRWWAKQMLDTQQPLLERMTLFWHNFFPSSLSKTVQPSMLYEQNQLFRKHALGSFSELLHAVAKDPAMLLYLDGYVSTKEKPNENFARELLELFTVGLGHYKEADIRQAARAFTGWSIGDSGRYVFNKAAHDGGVKTFLGQRGPFTGEDIINRLLKHPATAQNVARQFWREFVSVETAPSHVINQWAQVLVRSKYSISALLSAVLNSNEFWQPRYAGALVKSPVDLQIGTLRCLPYSQGGRRFDVAHNLAIMGQALFEHPSVKGWDGGTAWVTTQSMLRRQSMLLNLARGNLNAKRHKSTVAENLADIKTEQFQQWLLPTAPLNPLPNTPGTQRLVRALVLDPSFQVL